MTTFLRQRTLRVANVALTGLYTLYRAHPAVWRLMARNYRPWMGRFARLHAWMTCRCRRADQERLPGEGTIVSRTADFSKAPAQGRAGAMFIGGTHYASPWTLLLLYRPWRRMLRQMTRMRGFRWHKTYYQWPLTLGTIAFFEDRDALLTFARSSEHRKLMCWLTDNGTKRARAGFIRIYEADPRGYSNGAWRAEDTSMGHIPAFTPLAREAEGPAVHRR